MIDPRTETIRYHEALYSQHAVFEPGTWLARPARYVLDALSHVPQALYTQVLDLGAGVGRHTLPIAQQLPNSRVLALDLLPLAVQRLRENAAAWDVADRIDAQVADVEHYALPFGRFDLVVACSVLEHLPAAALQSVLAGVARATAPGGIACLIIGADRHEIAADGGRRPAPIELQLGADAVRALLASTFEGWAVLCSMHRAVWCTCVRSATVSRTFWCRGRCGGWGGGLKPMRERMPASLGPDPRARKRDAERVEPMRERMPASSAVSHGRESSSRRMLRR